MLKQIFGHDTTSVLLWHVQMFVAIIRPVLELQQKEILIAMEKH